MSSRGAGIPTTTEIHYLSTRDLRRLKLVLHDNIRKLEARIHLLNQRALNEEVVEEKAENRPGDIDSTKWHPPPFSIPICADAREFDFARLAEGQLARVGRKFDVVMMDPPWQIATANPTRGVAIGYEQMPDITITDLEFGCLQDNGFMFLWVVNSKFQLALNLFDKWGYTYVDDITWVKSTVNRRLAKGHGFYLQHAKETCIIGKKGDFPPSSRGGVVDDVIFSVRRGQSQKPAEIY
eukprot:148793_1